MLYLWRKTTSHVVDAGIQVFSKTPTYVFAAQLFVAGWIKLLIFSTCTGLCFTKLCSKTDGMTKFLSSKHNKLTAGYFCQKLKSGVP